MSNDTDWDELTADEQRQQLEVSGLTTFVDDLRHMFVQEDCGGDLNFHLYPLDAEGRATFASLSPSEVRRLHGVLSERIAQYPAESSRKGSTREIPNPYRV